jgi:hypothetical protein
MAAMGHEPQFPPPEPSGRNRFGQGTFAGTRGNERDAPQTDLRSMILSINIGSQWPSELWWPSATLMPAGVRGTC